ncbi:MAG: hypothetical protein R3E82_06310 [Pseudomonadales bacterium]
MSVQAIRIRLLCIVGFAWLTGAFFPSASAATAEQLIEEVRVTAFNGCGPWPISHRLISTCSYAQLKREKLETVNALRTRQAAVCLVCDSNICRPARHRLSSEADTKLCRKLFWTPTRVGVIRRSMVSSQDLVVDFSYGISREGRVTDIRITYLESELSRRKVLALIREGAAQISFEPVEVAGAPVEIVDLAHGYTLQAR